MQRSPHHPRRLPDRADVIVIGAGAAGIFAMRELVQSERTAICLEARNRIGGRIFTRRSLARHPIELGAEFVHGTETVVHQLVAEFGLTVVPHVGEAYSWLDGKLLADSQLPRPPLLALHEVRRLAERLRRAGQGTTPLAAFLNSPELHEILARSAITRRYVEQLIKNDHSVEPTVLTLEGWLEPDVTGYEENFRIDEGYSALLHRAVATARLDIRLNRPVHRIEWEHGSVRVFARNLLLQARAAIITLPLGVLQHGDVEFDSPLPRPKIDAIRADSARRDQCAPARLDSNRLASAEHRYVPDSLPRRRAIWTPLTTAAMLPAATIMSTKSAHPGISKRGWPKGVSSL